MDEKLIGVPALSDRFDLPRSWIYANAAAGVLPHLRLGKYLKFRPSEVDAWLEAQRRGPRVEPK